MRRFGYHYDALFLTGCTAYAVNRWLIKPYVHTGFIHDHFNDCWLIPCALPLVLWMHRRLGLRGHDEPPRMTEVISHLLFWSLFFKGIGPAIFQHVTADLWDIPCYWAGGAVAWVWWHKESFFHRAETHEL